MFAENRKVNVVQVTGRHSRSNPDGFLPKNQRPPNNFLLDCEPHFGGTLRAFNSRVVLALAVRANH